MFIKGMLKENTYADSMVLMALSTKVNKVEGVAQAMVGMGTPLNKQIIEEVGLMVPCIESATARDMMLVVQCETEAECDRALEHAWQLKNEIGQGDATDDSSYRTLARAQENSPDSSLVLISVPGKHAAAEARKALAAGNNVMIFSDNVSLADEVALKTLAHEKGLLVMGPDCGTAIINGGILCFGNVVAPGPVGIVAASGTGAQEVSVQIDALGSGISQLVGVGGRDLSEEVGGRMMLDGLSMLAEDAETEVIVLISKPPAESVARAIVEAAGSCRKPVVVCFIGDSSHAESIDGVYRCSSTYDAAVAATSIALGRNVAPAIPTEPISATPYAPQQKFARGLFCGGTICDEVLHRFLDTFRDTYSNIAKSPDHRLAEGEKPHGHCLIDLGSDEFTVGRPHPMIDPSLRNLKIVEAAKDPEVAVIALDFVLGYGSHENPVGAAAEAIAEATDIAHTAGRNLKIVAYVLGTPADPQDKQAQIALLADWGVETCSSVADLANCAIQLVPKQS